MRILGLDIATRTGFGLLRDGVPEVYGARESSVEPDSKYPFDVAQLARGIAVQALSIIRDHRPDLIVVEDTNIGGRAGRRSQKVLEFAHAYFLEEVATLGIRVVYVSTSEWRRALGLILSKADKEQNKKLSRVKSAAKKSGTKLTEAKKAAGIAGRITIKHAAVNYVNQRFDISLRKGQDDEADALCLCLAAISLHL